MADKETLKQIVAEIKFRHRERQSDIANKLGIKPTYLSDMLNGRVPFTDAIYTKISEIYSDCIRNQNITGNSNTQINGNENYLIDSNSITKSFEEIEKHRQLIEQALKLIEKKDEQIDKMIEFICQSK